MERPALARRGEAGAEPQGTRARSGAPRTPSGCSVGEGQGGPGSVRFMEATYPLGLRGDRETLCSICEG